jgi:hypothetical protein
MDAAELVENGGAAVGTAVVDRHDFTRQAERLEAGGDLSEQRAQILPFVEYRDDYRKINGGFRGDHVS